MITHLIEQFYALQSKIETAIQEDSSTKISELDRELMSTWDKILSVETTTVQDKQALSDFLLDHLSDTEKSSDICSDIKHKFSQLIAKQH